MTVDRTKDGPFRRLSGTIALVQSLGIVPVFAGILTIANAVSLWPAGVALIVFGILVTTLGYMLSYIFCKAWEEIFEVEPNGYLIISQLQRFGRKERINAD